MKMICNDENRKENCEGERGAGDIFALRFFVDKATIVWGNAGMLVLSLPPPTLFFDDKDILRVAW